MKKPQKTTEQNIKATKNKDTLGVGKLATLKLKSTDPSSYFSITTHTTQR